MPLETMFPKARSGVISGQQDELRRLKSEPRRVTEKRDILKGAAAFFASESRKSTRSYNLDPINTG